MILLGASSFMSMTQKQRLIQFLAGMGVRYVETTGTYVQTCQEYQEWRDAGVWFAPFTEGLGILKEEATIVSIRDHPWPHILHEAGHLLCTEEPLPPNGNELDWLGWEYAVCQLLGLSRAAFIRSNQEYMITWLNPKGQWRDAISELTAREIPLFLADRVNKAKELGLVLPDGQVTCHPNRKLPPVPFRRPRRAFRSRSPDHAGT